MQEAREKDLAITPIHPRPEEPFDTRSGPRQSGRACAGNLFGGAGRAVRHILADMNADAS